MKTFCVDRTAKKVDAIQSTLHAVAAELIEIETSLLPHPFYIRRHTSDFKNLHQIFVMKNINS